MEKKLMSRFSWNGLEDEDIRVGGKITRGWWRDLHEIGQIVALSNTILSYNLLLQNALTLFGSSP